MLSISDRQIKKYGIEFFLLFNYYYPMLTKKDLSAIQAMLEILRIDIRGLIQKNTDNLIELITTGFNIQDAGFSKTDKVLNNHEKRIGLLEEKNFKTN